MEHKTQNLRDCHSNHENYRIRLKFVLKKLYLNLIQ